MIETIYIEEAIKNHARTRAILNRFSDARQINCERYGEVFNPKAQNFRLQKQKPALILAEKFKNFVLDAPPGYGIGAKKNYYFSHMLNCLYDCRYCFLQGMYQSANYVLFVNYEDFQKEIQRIAQAYSSEEIHFFAGYDCDSLALEPVSGFTRFFLPCFQRLPNAWIELRTKSTQIRALLEADVSPNTIVAFSFTPAEIAEAIEHKTPTVSKRLNAMCKLQQQGWKLGLRFDPLIYHSHYQEQYRRLFQSVFMKINLDALHSVSLGCFRLPYNFFRKLQKLYPDEKLFSGSMENKQGMVSYKTSLEIEMTQFCTTELLKYIPPEKFFPCSI